MKSLNNTETHKSKYINKNKSNQKSKSTPKAKINNRRNKWNSKIKKPTSKSQIKNTNQNQKSKRCRSQLYQKDFLEVGRS